LSNLLEGKKRRLEMFLGRIQAAILLGEGQNSLVCIAMKLRTEGPSFESWKKQDIFLFSKRPYLL
jgi:hypothetical protein